MLFRSQVSDFTISPQDVKNEEWFIYYLNIHVWNQDDGTINTRKILSRIYKLLHTQVLTLDSGYKPAVYMLFSQVLEDPDGITIHGISRFKIVD